MASLLRRGLQCFYCGRRSAQPYRRGLAEWHCDECDATNYLDDNGDITDPPESVTAATTNPNSSSRIRRYASQAGRSISPPMASQDPIFCRRCLNNQSLLTQQLSQYLPPPDDPRYEEFNSKYPDHMRGLQERYPQVCKDCDARVQARIRETGYAAKTDHLRRMTERTRKSPKTRHGSSWYDLWVSLEACCWWLSLLGQVSWNALGALASSEAGLSIDETPKDLRQCVSYAIANETVHMSCVTHAEWMGTASIVLAALSIRFNPSMLRGPFSRATGLMEYYKLELILNLLRLVSRYFLGDSASCASCGLDPVMVRAMHAVMLTLNIVISIIAYRTAKIDPSPRVSFQDHYEPLEPRQQWTQDSSLGHRAAATDRPPGTNSELSHFPIGSLATPRQRSETPCYPPTPAPDDDDSDDDTNIAASSIADPDAMDIDTPVKDQFTLPPTQPYQQSPPPPERSPFHGVLPAAPVNPAHRLRNPPNKPTFQRASASSQRNFFGDLHREEGDLSDAPPDTPNTRRNYEMAPQSFFSPRSTEDTGLEALFKGIFSLNDEPPELRRPESSHPSKGQPIAQCTRPLVPAKVQRSISAIGLSLSVYAWQVASASPSSISSYLLGLFAPTVASLVAGNRLVNALRPSRPVWLVSDIIFLAAELGLALTIAYYVYRSRLSPNDLESSLGSFPLLFLGAMAIQEAVSCISEIRRSNSEEGPLSSTVPGEQPSQSPPRRTSSLPTEKNQSFGAPLDPSLPAQMCSPAISSNRSHQLNRSANTPARTTRSQTRTFNQADGERRDSVGSSSGFAGLTLGNSPDAGFKGRTWQGRGVTQSVPPWHRGTL